MNSLQSARRGAKVAAWRSAPTIERRQKALGRPLRAADVPLQRVSKLTAAKPGGKRGAKQDETRVTPHGKRTR